LAHELTIEVANHPISMEIEGDAFLHPVREAYHPFSSDRDPEFRLSVYPDHNLMVQDESSVGLTFSNGEVKIVDDYLRGSLDLRNNTGEIRINPVWFIASLAIFVRNMFTLILILKDQGLVLHAVAVLRDGEGYVFLGPSGSGKTTVAQLSPECVVLSDDIVFVKPFGHSYAVFPTPCWGDMQRGDRENRGYPLKMMFKLARDSEVYLRPYGLAEGISEVFTIPHIPLDTLSLKDVLKRYRRLLAMVPCYEMHFARDGRFWQAIDRERMSLALKEG